jgi:hypothetical protein
MCGEGDVGFGYENFVNLLLCSGREDSNYNLEVGENHPLEVSLGREDSNYTLGGWLKSPPRSLFVGEPFLLLGWE